MLHSRILLSQKCARLGVYNTLFWEVFGGMLSAELTLSQLKQFLPVIYSWLSKYTQQHTADFTQQLNNWSPHLLKRAIIVRYHFLVLGSIGSCNTEGDYCIKNKQTKPSIFLVILHDHAHHRRHDFFWQNSFGYRNTSLFIRWGH